MTGIGRLIRCVCVGGGEVCVGSHVLTQSYLIERQSVV